MAIGAVAIALLVQSWILLESRSRALSLLATRAANRAQSTSDGIEAVFEQLDLALLAVRDRTNPEEVIAGPSEVTRTLAPSMHQLLRSWQDRAPQAKRLHVVSANGDFVYSTVKPVPSVGVGDRPYFQRQIAASRDFLDVTEAYRSRVAGDWTVLVSRRLVTHDGRFAGLILAAIGAEALHRELTAVDQQQWFLSVFDHTRQLVASNPAQPDWLGRHFSEDLLAQGFERGNSAFRGLAFDLGERQIWATRRVGRLPLLTVAAFPESLALRQWRQDLEINLIVAALLASGTVLLLLVHRRYIRATEAITVLGERMQLATSSVKLGIWEWDGVNDLLSWDETAGEIFVGDFRKRSVTREAWLAGFSSEERANLNAALTMTGPAPFEVRVQRDVEAGDRRFLRLKGVVQRGDAGRTVGALGVVWDDTHVERVQHQLRASEEYFRTLFDAVPHAVAVVEGGRVVDSNMPYRTMFGIEVSEMTPPWGMAVERQSNGELTREAGERFYRAALDGKLQQTTWQCRRRDGTVFEAELRASLFRHEGRLLVVATVRDLTEQRSIEERLHQAQKLDALGKLAGGVAHDFNNMLAAILGAAELISPVESAESLGELRETIVMAAERAAGLTSKLLSFARKGKLLSTLTDVHAVLSESVALLERTLDRRISITLNLNAQRSTVLGDASQLQNAILNLGVNARDAMPEGGSLTFTTEVRKLADEDCHQGAFHVASGEYLTIRIADTGCGVPPELQEHIFDPFFTTKEIGKGTGLGLAAVFGTMASHRGAVTVESAPGQGAQFTLYLPLANGEVRVSDSAQARVTSGTGTVLVIDDEEMVRFATGKMLTALGYQPLSVAAPEEAVDVYRGHGSDVVAVVVDMVMPKLSGLDVAQRLRGAGAHVPIILVSGFPRSNQLDPWFGKVFDGFLQKPFSTAELGKLLAQLCSKTTTADRPS